MIDKQKIKIIIFDADDTLWENETFFRAAEEEFCNMLEDYLPHHAVTKELYKKEVENVEWYGYGIKSFVLSMIETATSITGNTAGLPMVTRIIEIGREMMSKPVVLLDGVLDVLEALKGNYKLVVATKGDLVDQERKLNKSGIMHYFHHIEIMSEKGVADYKKLIRHLDCKPEELVMIGNSLKSDVLPIIELGGVGVHIPFHTTWELEVVKHQIDHDSFLKLNSIVDLLPYLT